MTQEIKVDISANTQGTKRPMDDLGKSTDGVAEALEGVSKQARKATSDLERYEAISRRVASAQQILQRALGKPVDAADATLAIANFDKLRKGRTIGMRQLREFDSFEDWMQ